MKLYIWNEPYEVKYGSSILHVVAGSLDEAKEQAKSATYAQYGMPSDAPSWLHAIELGEPTRVLDLPCAEFYEWAE